MADRVWVQLVPHGRVHAAQRFNVAGTFMYRLPCASTSSLPPAIIPQFVYDQRPDGLAVCAKPRCSRILREEEGG